MVDAILKGGPENGKSIRVDNNCQTIELYSSLKSHSLNIVLCKYNRVKKQNKKTYIFEYEERPGTRPDPSGD